uniref:NADH dehydrogenase subunit 4 n=1 Tax=Margattea spinifera TaxID=1928775 RepID=UPI0027A88794|nr:NADH dehydrogenase subunit 4 [Margattea spinifera]WGO57855.1 NADH dehydrogenase subunit 4 [Margattea spinifera]
MLKIVLFVIFLIPICFLQKIWWVVQSYLFILMFIYMNMLPFFYCFGNISYFFGFDYISFGLIGLSIWICVLMLMASESVFFLSYFNSFFMVVVLVLMLMLICTFSSMTMFSFYLFFESSLIPTLFLIMGWGYQPERLQAGVYLLFYTLLASLPLLVGIMYLYNCIGSLAIYLIGSFTGVGWLMYFSMIMAFLVKMPMYMVHLWLPKAHVEAPISGSMILAGVLLKLGGYGLLRFMVILTSIGTKLNYMWISISLVGGVLVSMMCLRQTDLKSLIAYSSVAHMGMVISGLMTMMYWGYCGSYSLMIGHGLCSSGLFCLANISYERLGSRSLLINKGLMNFMPSLSMWWFLLCSCNMAAPPSLNLIGEIMLLNSLVGWSWITMFMLMLLSFFSAVYTLYLFSYSQHGMLYSGMYCCSLGYIREFLLLFLHWFPLNVLILCGDYMVIWL